MNRGGLVTIALPCDLGKPGTGSHHFGSPFLLDPHSLRLTAIGTLNSRPQAVMISV